MKGSRKRSMQVVPPRTRRFAAGGGMVIMVVGIVMGLAACSNREDGSPVAPATPEVAAQTSCSTTPPPKFPGEQALLDDDLISAFITTQICTTGNLSPANAQSALVKWLAIIREGANPSTTRVLGLFDFVSKNWLDGLEDAELATFKSDLLLVVFGVDAPDDVPVTIQNVPATGASLCDVDGLSCYTFPPGWSAVRRLTGRTNAVRSSRGRMHPPGGHSHQPR